MTQHPAAAFRRPSPSGLPITVKTAIALGVVLLISGMLGAQFARSMLIDTERRMILSELESLSRAQALRVVDELESEIGALDRLRIDSTVQARLKAASEVEHSEGVVFLDDDAMAARLRDYIGIYPEFTALAVVDNHGHVLASIPALPQDFVADAGSWYWYRAVAERGWRSTYVSGPQSDGLTGMRGTHIALPVSALDNPTQVIGVLYAVWDMENLPASSQVRGHEDIILTYSGQVISGPDDAGSHLPDMMLSQMHQRPSGSFAAPEGNGEYAGWMYGYTRFSDLGLQSDLLSGVEWIVVTREPLSVLAADVSQLSRQLYLVFGLSSILITAVISVLVMLLLRPLRRLTDAAERIRAGDMATEIPTSPPDEVGTLADVLRGLVGELVRRVRQLDAATRVSQATGRFLKMDDLLDNATRSITLEFRYPGVDIFLLASSPNRAVLRAARGRLGGEVGTTVEVDVHNPVGRAIILGEPQAGFDEAASYLVLPLGAAERPLGALRVTAGGEKTFDQQTVGLLTLVSDQLSTSIHNARLFEASAGNLAEIEALNQRLTGQAWKDLFGRDAHLRYTLDPVASWPRRTASLLYRDVVVAETYTDIDGREILAAPLVLRGATIGTLSAARPAGSRWTRDEHMLIEAVAMRLATIAEGIRLVEETSWRAELEQRVNDVSASLLQRAASVDDVLRTALGQFSQALDSDRVALRLGAPTAEPSTPRRNGNREGEHDGR